MPISTSSRHGRRPVRRAAAVLLVLAPALAAAACAAPDPAPTVASLAASTSSASSAPPAPTGGATTPAADPSGASDPSVSGGTPSATADASAAGGRPQFRLDDTDERRTALVNAYSQCLLDHGATKGQGREAAAGAAAAGGGDGGTPLIVVADPVPPGASAACADTLPLLPPEVEAATNPDFRAQSQAYVVCMRDRGLWVQLLTNHDLDWTYVDDHPVPTNSVQIEHECLLKAFS